MHKIYQLNSELFKVTGIQRVIMDIHEALRPLGAKLVGNVSFQKVAPELRAQNDDYIRMNGYSMFRNSIVIIHERRYLPIFWLLNKFLRFNTKVIYVHHNELYGQKRLSIFPDHVVAISDAGIFNLTKYFGVPREHITKIHNCVRQPASSFLKHRYFNPEKITILYPARINSVKRQIEIVHQLRGKLDMRVRILFAGIGPDYEKLTTECGDSEQFVALGFRSDVLSLMQQVDFIMLFSKHEGLPICLIEACMTGTPIITNDVGGNTEIAFNEKNASVVDDWDKLVNCLNGLPKMTTEKYNQMANESRKVYDKYYQFSAFASEYNRLVKNLMEE